jgi:two-component system response regulator (stage 0 sporulation protein F)
MSKKIKLLYVDDEPINLLLFKSMFEKKYQVLTAESGYEAIEILTKNADIDVVVSDMKMPLMNGLEFIAKVKPQYPKIYFYMLSGYELTAEIKESISKGLILQYFQKPFKMAEIDKCIEENFKK